MASLFNDFRTALRSLVQQPGFTAVAVITLALGVGATAAIFTLVDAVILSPLPFDEQDRLVVFGHAAPARGLENANQCAAWHFTYEDEARVFEDLGMYRTAAPAVRGETGPEILPGMIATNGVFGALRLRPAVGRLFTPEDDDLQAPAIAMLGHSYWQKRYSSDPSVIGQTIEVDGITREIVGVLPASIQSLGFDPAIIYPWRFDKSTLFVGNIGASSVARLLDDVTLEQAEAELVRVMPMAWEKFPGGPVASSSLPSMYTPFLTPLKEDLVGSVSNLLWILMGGVAVVLLIACANVANLFLVRAEGRVTEMAVRAAIGASRGRIGWEYMKESLLLGLLGGLVGLPLAVAGLRILLNMAPTQLPRMAEVDLSPAVYLFALGVSLAAGLFFGVFPALRHGRTSPVVALKQGGHSGMAGKGRNRAQNILAVSQLALALVLLVASGLMLRSFQELQNVDPGFHNPDDVLPLRINIPSSEVGDRAEMALTHERIARGFADLPGVESVGIANTIAMDGYNNVNPFYVDGVEPPGGGTPPSRRHNWVGEGYFETMQIPVLAGRTITWDDIHNRAPVVVLSESLAREYFGSPQAAIGARVAAQPHPPRWHEVVGVVADVREDGVDIDPPLLVYWPQVTLAFWEGNDPDAIQTWRYMGYAIRSSRVGTPGFAEDVRRVVAEVNPNLPIRQLSPLTDLMAQSIARTSFTMVLLATAAGVALILGLVGVYGVISYAVSQRGRELGMRMALGAEPRHVKSMVLGQGLRIFVVGTVVGLGLAFALTRLMSALLFGVEPVDPLTFALVPMGLLVVSLLASYLPARRAARVDLMEALRRE
jgi:predicted permease